MDFMFQICGALFDTSANALQSDFSLSLIGALFMAGLVGGATHCVAMCGPFVLAQKTAKLSDQDSAPLLRRLGQELLLPYHLGRITTYVVLAMLLGSVLNLAFLFMPVRAFLIAPILALAGLIFIVSAIPALGRVFPWAAALHIPFAHKLYNSSGFVRLRNALPKQDSLIGRYFMGVFLGFIPCGLTLAALMAASSAPHPVIAGAAMAAFGLGTMPALMASRFGFQAFGLKYPNGVKKAQRALMVFSGLWLFALAGMVLIKI